MTTLCTSLEEVRQHINQLDNRLLSLIGQRAGYVAQAARFKKNAAEVPAPQRVEQLVARLVELARQNGIDPKVIEATWRAMIGAFIAAEQQIHTNLMASPASASPAP